MANVRSISVIPIFIFYIINISEALYEDQVGKFDWKRTFIGKVKYASFEGQRIIVATEENVLASLQLKTGNILWRHVLENPLEHKIDLLRVGKEIISVSGGKNLWYIRGWDIHGGSILWEWTVNTDKIVHSEWIIYKHQLIHIIPVLNSHLEVTIYHVQTGEVLTKTKRIAAPWVVNISNCVTANTVFACLSSESSSGQLYSIDLLEENAKVSAKPLSLLLDNDPGSVQILNFEYEEPALLLLKNNKARLVTLNNGDVKSLPYNLLSNAVNILKEDRNSIFQLELNTNNPDKLIKVLIKDYETGRDENTIDIEYPFGLGAPYTIAGQCRGSSCDLLLSSTDNALVLVHLPEGKTLWTREEALSGIVSSEFFELPVSELDASIENEFKTSSGDIISMLIHRLSTQVRQVSSLLFGNQLLASNGLIRDEFGLHKIIVVATKVGKLFGIDTLTGSIAWSHRLPNVKPFDVVNKENILLFVQRTARYAPLPAQCTVIAQDLYTGNGVIFQFDPITGLPSSELQRLNYKIKQAMILPYEDVNNLKPIIVLSEQNEVYVYPTSAKNIVVEHAKTIYFYTVDMSKSVLQGYSLAQSVLSNLKANLVWEFKLGSSKLLAITTRPSSERVHSQGRVLPNRSVYYKYVNPNLIAIATITEDPIHKHVLSVYLVDGINGLVLYSTSHKRAKGPVHLVHSENWLVYTYFSERFRRTELAASELYEGETQSNSTVFSSHAVSQLPRVLSESYILPATPETMTVTLTERGITNKFLLATMTNGLVVEIAWMLVQPRLPDVLCSPEEGCIPYMPEIPLPTEATLNYNQTLIRTKGIQVAPARLESTSHVLVYGLDIFYTRVAPSKTFDVLKDDFDHKLIILVLSALVIASYITKQLASRKAIKQAWK